MIKGSQELLDKSYLWRLKTYYIFPVAQHLRFLDLCSRFLFPCAYLAFVLASLSEVKFGLDQRALLESSESIRACYCQNARYPFGPVCD